MEYRRKRRNFRPLNSQVEGGLTDIIEIRLNI